MKNLFKRIKVIVFLLLVFLDSTFVVAQQKPHYSQYLLNQYIVNPALTGIENYTDVKISRRQQWVGMIDAPVTTYITAHTALGKKDYRLNANSYQVPDENPRGKPYWEDYTAAEPHHGIGMQIINDRTGPLNNFSAYATYAYHIGISPKASLAAGFGLGVSQVSINTAKLNFVNVMVDPALAESGILNSLQPDLMAGLYLYSADYFVGLSGQQILQRPISFADNIVRTINGKTIPHLFATAGYRIPLGDDFNFIPSVMVKYIHPIPVQVEYNTKLQYWDRFWIGAGYRHNDGYSGMAGLNVSNLFNVSYSYDYTTTRLNTISKGTHEIMIGFLIGNKYGDWCPKNVW